MSLFTASGAPQNSGPGSSIEIRAEFLAVQAALEKLGDFSSMAGHLIGVNAGGTDIESKGPYAVDTWTPDFTFETPGDLTIVYTSRAGRYIRLGGLVIAFFYLDMGTFTHTTAAGQAQISGLPAPNALGTLPFAGSGVLHMSNVTFAGLHVTPYATASIIQLIGATSATTPTTIGIAHFATGAAKLLSGFVAYLA